LHWWATRPGGCLAAARELQKQGKVRHVGFSTHAEPALVLDTVRHEADGGFDYVNLHWYYIKHDNWPAVEAATANDMGVFIISPADKGGMLYQPSAKLVELCQPLHPLVFNCVYCLSHPQVHTLSLGASQPSDFHLQCSSLEFLPRADELLPPILERLRTAMVDAVGENVADHYADGLPDWWDAPGYTSIRTILWLRNLAMAYDMTDYAKMRYNLLGNGGHWFGGLNAAHADELDFTTALKDSPFAEQIPGWLRESHAQLFEAPKKRLSESD
jgi:predicted aldo/keto reductase-like oxidoreductase